jgi:predicted Zn-dependent protease
LVTLVEGGSSAYAATCELSRSGLAAACDEARRWLESSREGALYDPGTVSRPRRSGHFASAVESSWDDRSLADKIDLLMRIDAALAADTAIVDRQSKLSYRRVDKLFCTSDGIEITQHHEYLVPGYAAVANRGGHTQMRTGGGWGAAVQGGMERLAAFDFEGSAGRVAAEALALLDAPECPDTTTDVVLMPNQMMLQIHETIGHPLELDRILGDERNFAGSSFVELDMFGHYRYGSDWLDVTFDPTVVGEAASYAFDDEGFPAERTYLIRNGVLQRPLGSARSAARAGIQPVANARASNWNRPAIDRIANLNVEPRDLSLESLVGKVERGVLLDTNRSWSVDDRRDKFQFGCEMGWLIEDGERRGLVRNPSYRGRSVEFWRSLAGVGDAASREIWGSPFCGKGEPNQMIMVGHASPPCLFRHVEVFGGD